MGAFEIVSQTKRFTRYRTCLDWMFLIHLNFRRNFLKGPDKCGSSSLDGRHVCFHPVRTWWPAALLFGMMSGTSPRCWTSPFVTRASQLQVEWRSSGFSQSETPETCPKSACLRNRSSRCRASLLSHFLSWNSHKLNLRWRLPCSLRRKILTEELLHDENWSPWGSAP